ncbi:hypothetical protein [Nitratireductor sp. GCM10026969]|uniref:hypothetical protein n=1 Tax=Nitratireductor sp. GCM10026969 TaxID=3252645 RepID=UPI0036243145
MLKFLLAAVWISAATLASVLYSFQMSQAAKDPNSAPAAFFGGLDYIRTPVISVPVATKGGVGGYFLARLAYTVEPKKLKALSVPAEMLLVDELHDYLYGNPQIDFSDRAALDLDAFREGIRDGINARVGDTLVHEVLIEQIDYLSKSEIRDNIIRRRINPTE